MEALTPEEENITNDVRNLFRLEKETKSIKDRILRYIKNLFEDEEEENCFKPVWVNNFWNNNYIEYKSNGNKNKAVSVEEYIHKIISYLKDTLQKKWNFPLRISSVNVTKSAVWSYLRIWSFTEETLSGKLHFLCSNIINNLKKSDMWNIQLTIANNFISSMILLHCYNNVTM